MSADVNTDQTPLMRQYWDLKSQAGDALLLFRMGDFYELFGDDAVTAAGILEITLTSRDKNKPNPMPMAGVPHHSVQGYLQKLLRAGKKVAIGEQIVEPSGELSSDTSKSAGKAIVRREVTRTFTPGVQFDNEGSEANYLGAVTSDSGRFVLACLDASTGEALVSQTLDEATLALELGSLPIHHVIHFPEQAQLGAIRESDIRLVEELPPNYVSAIQAAETLKKQYGIDQLGAFLETEAQIHALASVVTYALRSQKQERLEHLRLPQPLRKPKTLILGPRTAQHLDLVPSDDATPNLYQLINRTRCALGARALKRWLLSPLKSPDEITARQDAVKELFSSQVELAGHLSARLSEELSKIYDLERISGRINTRLANPRDTLALGRSLSTLSMLSDLLSHSKAPALKELREQLAGLAQALSPLAGEIVKTQLDDAPLTARDGGIFAPGKTSELDHLLSLNENGQRWLIELETRERENTGISSLKVRYNRVFGYYIEITQAHLKNVPSHYQRKQTTVGAERFFTEELKKFEDEIVNASSRQKALEAQLFDDLLQRIQAKTQPVMEAARTLGELDALLSLARLAEEPGWTFPEIDGSLDMEIVAGRHPLVDQATRGAFVPNDLDLSPKTRLTLMITGPNMGGKSTVMRQTALIVVLGQMGAPVPASRARWGSVSALYTRIGAHDAIARGQSTFMVEMSELAHILHHADERSLIILDEIGRGTSTYDGISVAWATLEWICKSIRSRTLFATHYHELTRLTDTLPHLANAHMAVEGARTQGGSLRFLYKLKEGPTNDSFGIHVARIAGLPKPVVERAWKVLEELETHSAQTHEAASTTQLSLFGAPTALAQAAEPAPLETPVEPHPVMTELDSAKIEEMTPIQALNFVVRLQELSRQN